MKKRKKYKLSRVARFSFRTTKESFIEHQLSYIDAQKSLAELTQLCNKKIKFFEDNYLIK
ncbi:hypothetical protein HCC36_15990 [Listeria booriae]|uniref:Uncharacterized protein n=1 Tax=Listeria booriae TaxID=1552123 RepID=A0A842G4V1_9LIST|nr:hypothetical protein [Listeria booriae]MBC2294724.1 hypothetical protein [Listeria booriae]